MASLRSITLFLATLAVVSSLASAAGPASGSGYDIQVYSGTGDDGLTYEFDTYAGWK
jgi:hypothetical protein